MKTIVTKIPSRTSFFRGENTLEIGYPWLTFGAIMALEHILGDKKDMKILEMGSGGSTIFFSKRCGELLTLEHDPKWGRLVGDKLMPNNPHVTVAYFPPEELLEIVKQQGDGYFDMVLADGGPSYYWREKMMNASIPKLKQGGWMILDNYALFNFDYTTGWDVYTFDMFMYHGHGTRICKKISF